MNKEEIIKLYLADLNNLVPDSDAKRSRIIDLEDELLTCKLFTHPLPPKEEAERLVNHYFDKLFLPKFESVDAAKIDIENTITALQLRGLDTTYEEEVLTILKGM